MDSPFAPGCAAASAPNEALLSLYASLLSGLTIALALTLDASGLFTIGDIGTVILLSCLALVVERQSVAVADHVQLSISVLPILFAALALGPGAAMVVGASALLLDCRPPFKRWVIWTSSRATVAGLAGLLALLVAGNGPSTLGMLLVAALVIAAFEAVMDAALTAITIKLRGVGEFSDTLITLMQVLTAALPLYAPLLAVVAYTFRIAGLWAAMLVLIPSLAAQRLFVMYREQRRLTSEVTEALSKLERVSISFAAAMVAALDARDHYTAGHSATVAVYARDTAARMGLSVQQQEQAHLCGLLHDIGKIGIVTGLLEKRGPLTDEERAAVEMHAEIGAAILDRVEGYEEVAEGVRHHHERFDGTGYPHMLSGQAIPVLARIVAVADAYSAMTSERPYRNALSSAEAKTRLEREAGRQLDPRIVKAFVQLLSEASDDYARGQEEDFAMVLDRLATDAEPAFAAV